MKKIITSFLFLIFCFATKAQSINDAPFKLAAENWKTVAPKSTLLTSTNEGINYNSIPGAAKDVRIYQGLSTPMPERFTVAFNFTVTNVSATGAALLPLVFTSGELAPSNPDGRPSEQTNQNALGILFQTPLKNNKILQIAPYVKTGAVPQTELYNKFIKIDYNKPYTIILTRCNKTMANITVKLDGVKVGEVPFVLPQNLDNLNYIQAANMVQASQYRNCSATATQFYYAATNEIGCAASSMPTTSATEITTLAQSPPMNTGIIDYEDLTSMPIEKVNPGCCQIAKVQFGQNKNGYVTEDINRYKNQLSGCSSDVLNTNRSLVFPGRVTINYGTNLPADLFRLHEFDTARSQFQIFKNKKLIHVIKIIAPTRKMKYYREEFIQVVDNKYIPTLTNQYFYSKLGDDFPAYCISYKNGDSTKYIKINYFGKKRNINSFTLWNSETNNTVNYTVVRDNDKYTRFYNGNPLHYYVGLHTPDKPNPILNCFAFAGDLITDIIPDKELDGATKIHFDYTFIKRPGKSYITSLSGTNGTYITYEYDCNNDKPEIKVLPPVKQPPLETTPVEPPKLPTKDPKITPPPKEVPIGTTPVEPPKLPIKTPKNVMDPKEMKGKDKNKPKVPVKIDVPKDSAIVPIKKG